MGNIYVLCKECGTEIETGDLTVELKCPECGTWIKVD